MLKQKIMRKVGEKQKRQIQQIPTNNDEEFDEEKDYFVNEDDSETSIPFEINEVDFQTDYNGIEYFSSNIVQNSVSELVNLIMGNKQIQQPNPLTSVIKVSNDDNDVKMDEENESSSNKMIDGEEVGGDESSISRNEDLYGFISLIDLSVVRNSNFFKEFSTFLISNCRDIKLRNQMISVLNDSSGLIINEHVINLPTKLSLMLHQNLFNEFKKEINLKRISFFKYFIIIAKVYENVKQDKFELDNDGIDKDHKKKKVKGTTIFMKEEEQFYFNRSIMNYKIEMKNQHSFDEMQPSLASNIKVFKMVIVIQRDKINKIIKSMEKALTNFQ